MTPTHWDNLHTQARYQLQYPNEHVVRFLVHHRINHPNQRNLLDIGCGAGRHLRLAADLGYAATGIDSSREAITQTATRWLHATHGDMLELPYQNGTFDVALAIGSLYYGTLDDMRQSINEIHRVLNPDGEAFVTLRTARDSRRHEGPPNTTLTLTEPQSEHGLTCTFIEGMDILKLFDSFSEINWARVETIDCQTLWTDSDYAITARRPQ